MLPCLRNLEESCSFNQVPLNTVLKHKSLVELQSAVTPCEDFGKSKALFVFMQIPANHVKTLAQYVSERRRHKYVTAFNSHGNCVLVTCNYSNCSSLS